MKQLPIKFAPAFNKIFGSSTISLDKGPELLQRVKNSALRIALEKLLTDEYFSICTLDNCVRVAKITPPPEYMEVLRLLHCVKYSDMDLQTRRDIIQMISEIFDPEEIAID